MKKIAVIVGVVGAIIIILAAVLGFRVLPDYIDRKIEEEVSLRPMSETWEKWSNIDKPLYLSVYILNVTNKDTLSVDGYPKFQQVGPYSYRQRRKKLNLTMEGESLVSYEQAIHYFFDEETTGEGLLQTDSINVLNIPFYSVVAALMGSGLPVELLAHMINNVFLPNEQLIRTTTVEEIMFKGYDIFDITFFLRNISQTIPVNFKDDRFGIYILNNGSTDGTYKIHTGVGDSSVFGQILTWNGYSDLNLWHPLSECDRVKGSDGTIFPPFVEKERVVEIFSSELCRSIYLTYSSEETIKDIKGYKFTVPKQVLEDPRTNSDNRCFCNSPNVTNCLGAGVIDVSRCRQAPIVLSTPYFLDGDTLYSYDSGLYSTSRGEHETAFVIEPNSGALLKANKRIQINVNYKSFPVVNAMQGTNDMIFPVMWVDENTEFTDENAQELKDKLLSPKKAVETWRWVILAIGILLFLGGVILFIWKSRSGTSFNIDKNL